MRISSRTWLAALWVGTMIHLDWHLGRPGHDHRSFHLAYHWLLALPAFGPLAWLTLRRWPGRPFRAMAGILVLGILLGQGLEPLGELIVSNGHSNAFASLVRWRIFGEFLGAGLLVFLTAVLFRTRSSTRDPT